jgi:hypothetical protein
MVTRKAKFGCCGGVKYDAIDFWTRKVQKLTTKLGARVRRRTSLLRLVVVASGSCCWCLFFDFFVRRCLVMAEKERGEPHQRHTCTALVTFNNPSSAQIAAQTFQFKRETTTITLAPDPTVRLLALLPPGPVARCGDRPRAACRTSCGTT